MDELLEKIKNDFSKNRVRYSSHGAIRLYEHDIHKELLIEMIENSIVVEKYPDDYPCPSLLILMFKSTTPFHAVVAKCEDVTVIITVYLPDEDQWIDWSQRRK